MSAHYVTQEIQDSVSSLYIAFFGRAPDARGFGYWTEEQAAGASPYAIAANFGRSSEWLSNYGGLTPEAQVDLFYNNVFDRNPDAAGKTYWVNAIKGGLDFTAVAYQIIWAAYKGGAGVDPADNQIVNNKIDVAEYFAEVLKSNDTALAATALDGVTQDKSTADAAIARLAEAAATYTLTVDTDIATSNIFSAPLAWSPGGNERMNTLQDEDQLTGSGTNPTLTATLGNANDNGGTIITPTMTGVETINVAFSGSSTAAEGGAVTTLDLQDATGVDALNITRITTVVNQAEIGNIRDVVSAMSVANTQANDEGTVEFSFAKDALKGLNTGALTLNNVDLYAVNIGQNLNIASLGVSGQGYETLTVTSTGAANTVGNMNLPMDTGVAGTIKIDGDKQLTLATMANTTNGTQVEAVRYAGGIAGNYGRLAAVDASGLTAGLMMNIASGMLTTGKADTTGQVQNVTITGSKANDTFYLNDTVQSGDVINGADGTANTLVITGPISINQTTAGGANLLKLQDLEIRSSVSGAALVTVDADAFDSLARIYVRNEGQEAGVSAGQVLTVDLNDLTAAQATAITLAHGTTGNSTILNNILDVAFKTAATNNATQVTLVDGINVNPVFNAQLVLNSSELLTIVDRDTESNTIYLNLGTFTQAGSTITVKEGVAGLYMNFDTTSSSGSATEVNATSAAGLNNGYGRFTDGTAASNNTALTPSPDTVLNSLFTATNNTSNRVFYGTAGTSTDGFTRYEVENVLAPDFVGNLEIRLGDPTRANNVSSQNIVSFSGNDTFIFDRLSSDSAGFTSADTISSGSGTDTLAIDGNTALLSSDKRIEHGTSEWDNLSGIDVLRYGNNAGVPNGTGDLTFAVYGGGSGGDRPIEGATSTQSFVQFDGGAYYAHIDDAFVAQTDSGNRLTVVNNDGNLAVNSESDLVLDLTGLSSNRWVTFFGANGNGSGASPISSNRVVVDDTSMNQNMYLDGGDTDTRVVAGATIGNNNVLEIQGRVSLTDVTISDLSNTKNFQYINFTNRQFGSNSVLSLTLNNAIHEQLVDSNLTATSGSVETLYVGVTENDGAAVLRLDARDVFGQRSFWIEGGSGNDVITLNSNSGVDGDEGSTINFAEGDANRINWTGTATSIAITQTLGLGNAATHQFVGATTTTHNLYGNPEIVDISRMTYTSAAIDISGNTVASTVIGGSGTDTITGGSAADSLVGGLGNDVFIFGSAALLNADAVVGDAGTDTIRMETSTNALTLADADFGNKSGLETLALAGTGTQAVTLGANTNAAFANGITITTVATATSLNLNGSASTVAITATGTNNADTMTGGTVADILNGGSGADTITGLAGQDTLTGGAGSDVFVYTTQVTSVGADGANVDSIVDFLGGSGNDLIEIQMSASQASNSTLGFITAQTTGNVLLTELSDSQSVGTLSDVYARLTTLLPATSFAASADGTGTVDITAVLMTFTTGAAAGSYLVINDYRDGFQGLDDVVIDLGSVTGAFVKENISVDFIA